MKYDTWIDNFFCKVWSILISFAVCVPSTNATIHTYCAISTLYLFPLHYAMQMMCWHYDRMTCISLTFSSLFSFHSDFSDEHECSEYRLSDCISDFITNNRCFRVLGHVVIIIIIIAQRNVLLAVYRFFLKNFFIIVCDRDNGIEPKTMHFDGHFLFLLCLLISMICSRRSRPTFVFL